MSAIIKQFPTLFGQDKSGKTRVWTISVVLSDSVHKIHIQHGVLNGAMVDSSKDVKEGKNIGKKNETTPLQQALQIAEKTYKDKMEKDGYSLQATSSAEKETEFKGYQPMLAESWNPDSKTKRKVDIVFPCYSQPKLDGVRCLSYKKEGNIWVNQSRELKSFYHLDHINQELAQASVRSGFGDIVFDGELYKHNTPFNHIVGAVKKIKIKEADLETIRSVGYYVYDYFVPSRPDLTFEERYTVLKQILQNCKNLHLVQTDNCETKSDASRLHSLYVADNYEGLILRNKQGPYEHYRSRHLQKYKTFDDSEFRIVGFKEGEGNDAGSVIWKCQAEGGTFDVRPKGTLEERQAWFQEGSTHIGQMLTVKYQGMSEYGIPRFPVGIAIRDYE